MFLATTALDEFWDKKQEILFLGSWCIRNDRRQEMAALRYRVMPSPWDDRERFEEAAQYLDECFGRMLDSLTDYLNAVHHQDLSRRYWQILIGPWLFHGLHILYDRYIHLQEALARDPRLQTFTLDPQWFRTPQDTGQFVHWSCDDPFNLQLFSQLLEGMGLSFPTRGFRNGWPQDTGEDSNGGWPAFFKKTLRSGLSPLGSGLRRILDRRCCTFLCDLYLPRGIRWAMAWRTGLRALPVRIEANGAGNIPRVIPSEDRRTLASLPSTGEFERIFVGILPRIFPIQYLEDYLSMRAEVLQRYPRNPEVVVSAVGWYFNEPFKFLAGETAAQGGRLVAVQHGGGYGVHRRNPCERHEAQVSDSYWVWGWADPKDGRLRNLPAPRFSQLSRGFRKRIPPRGDSVLFIATDNPRYFCRFYSTPQGTQWEDYLGWQQRFFEAVPAQLRSHLCFRPHRHQFGNEICQRLSERFPELQWDCRGPLERSLQGRGLVVIDHLGTSLLEILVMNIPTVLFWNPSWWEIRSEAEPYFDPLRKGGILLDSPEAAAAKVLEIYTDSSLWWSQPTVQRARRGFVERFALRREDWVNEWAKALNQEVTLAKQQGSQPP